MLIRAREQCKIAHMTLCLLLSILKDTLWVLTRDEPLVHIFVDILLITKHVLDHDVSLES